MSPTPDGGARIGLIGCGTIASAVHLRVLTSMRGASLVAVADPDPEALRRAERASGVVLYEHAEELLGDSNVEAVVICAPSGTHARLAVAAAEAGKHVYLEKPIATTVEDAESAIDAVARTGIIAVMGFNRRSHPLFEQGRHVLRAGRIGRVRALHTAFCEPFAGPSLAAWKRRRETGGGVLLDLASHHFDLIRWFLDDEIGSVDATLRSDSSEHDSAWVHVRLRSEVEARSFFSFRSGTADFLEFLGERGVLRVDRYLPPAVLSLKREGLQAMHRARVPPSAAVAAWRLRRIVRPANEPSYRRALTRFVRRLQGERVELPTLADGLRSLEAILAAEESARAGEPVAP